MKKWALGVIMILFILLLAGGDSSAQCSICTKTTQQLGEKPARGLNSGILYLAFAPFAIVGFVAFRWWKSNKHSNHPH